MRTSWLLLALALPWMVGSPPPAHASDFWDEVRTPGLREWREHVEASRSAAEAGGWTTALEEADDAIEALPERAEAHVLRGRALGELGRTGTAMEALEHALDLDETALDAFEDGGHAARLAAAAGRYELAARILPRVLGRMRINSQRHDLYVLYGDVLMTLGPDRLREALVAYREAVRQGGRGNARAALGLALALRRSGQTLEAGDLAREAAARGRLEAVVAALPIPDGERAARRAIALAAIDDTEGAAEAWRAAAEFAPWREHAKRELAALGRSWEPRRRGPR